jgi:hypothetical protein
LNIYEKVKPPKIDKPEVKGNLNVPVFDITPTKIEIRKSIPKAQEDIEMNASIPELLHSKGDVKER